MLGETDRIRLASLEVLIMNMGDTARLIVEDLASGHRSTAAACYFLLEIISNADDLEKDPDRLAHGSRKNLVHSLHARG